MTEFEKNLQKIIIDQVAEAEEFFNKNYKSDYDTYQKYFESDPSCSRLVSDTDSDDSKLFIPRTREIIEAATPRYLTDITANVGKPFVEVIDLETGKKPDNKETLELEKHIYLRMQKMDFNLTALSAIKWAAIFGSAIGVMSPSRQLKRNKGFKGFSKFKAIDPRQYRFDPNAESYDEITYEILPIKISLADIEILSNNKHSNSLITTNISKILAQAKDEKRNFTSKDLKVKEWWGYQQFKNKQDIVQAWILDEELAAENSLLMWARNPYGNNESPVVFFPFELVPGKVLGDGIPAMIKPLQQELNELRNGVIDLIDRVLAPMSLVKEDALINPEEIKRWRRFGLVRVGHSDPLDDIIRQLSPANLSVLPAIISLIREYDTDIQVRTVETREGRGLPGVYGTPGTATEFQGKMTQFMTFISFNVNRFYDQFVKQVATFILEHDRFADSSGLTESESKYINAVRKGLNTDLGLKAIGVDPRKTYSQWLLTQAGQLATFLQLVDKGLREQGKPGIEWQLVFDKILAGYDIFYQAPIAEPELKQDITSQLTKIITDYKAKEGINVREEAPAGITTRDNAGVSPVEGV